MFARVEGAIAAPTAGLHFTERLLAELGHRGIRIATVTLHVGPGTFRPVTVDQIDEHQMAAEVSEVSEKTADLIRETQASGGRIIAIGTTVTRALETAARETGNDSAVPRADRPFHQARILFSGHRCAAHQLSSAANDSADARLALAGVDRLRDAYAEAVSARYRFYSYGDAMLIRYGGYRSSLWVFNGDFRLHRFSVGHQGTLLLLEEKTLENAFLGCRGFSGIRFTLARD